MQHMIKTNCTVFCQEPEYGKMIMCENPACQYIWFHYDCVALKGPGEGNGIVVIVNNLN